MRELLRAAGVSAADIAAVGVTGMLPAVVLLDEAGHLLRPSIQQSDARCGAEVEELRAEIDEKVFLAKAGNGINQQLVAAKLRWIERHEPEIFARIATVFGSYDYINWRLTGERAIEQNWALEAGFVDLATHAIDDALVALAHIPETRCRARSPRMRSWAPSRIEALRRPGSEPERRSSAAPPTTSPPRSARASSAPATSC